MVECSDFSTKIALHRVFFPLNFQKIFRTGFLQNTSGQLLPNSVQTFQRCFNVVFWLIQRRDVGQRQINVETTLCISTLEFTTSNNVESTLCISTLI